MSFVAMLTTDRAEVRDPAWEDVEREVGALDAREQTLVLLAPMPPLGPPAGDCHMAIGGGLHGRVIVYLTEDNLVFWRLREEGPRGGAVVRMLVGGQEGEYSERDLVSRDLALRAARRYMADGKRDPSLAWSTSE